MKKKKIKIRPNKKILIFIIFILMFLAFLNYCFGINKKMGFYKSSFIIVEERDTHGGFMGDGIYYLILDCSNNADKARRNVKDWTPLPFSTELELAMYGGEKDGIYYGYKFAEEAHLPVIRNGVYKFCDKNSSFLNRSDDIELLNRYCFNFEIAVYDLDNDFFYYFEIDT